MFLEKLGLESVDDLPAIAEFIPGPDVVESLEQPPPHVVVDLERGDDIAERHGPRLEVLRRKSSKIEK